MLARVLLMAWAASHHTVEAIPGSICNSGIYKSLTPFRDETEIIRWCRAQFPAACTHENAHIARSASSSEAVSIISTTGRTSLDPVITTSSVRYSGTPSTAPISLLSTHTAAPTTWNGLSTSRYVAAATANASTTVSCNSAPGLCSFTALDPNLARIACACICAADPPSSPLSHTTVWVTSGSTPSISPSIKISTRPTDRPSTIDPTKPTSTRHTIATMSGSSIIATVPFILSTEMPVNNSSLHASGTLLPVASPKNLSTGSTSSRSATRTTTVLTTTSIGRSTSLSIIPISVLSKIQSTTTSTNSSVFLSATAYTTPSTIAFTTLVTSTSTFTTTAPAPTR